MLVACTPVSDTRHVPPAAESTAADASETNNAGAGAGKAEERARLALGPMLGHVSPNIPNLDQGRLGWEGGDHDRPPARSW